MAEGNTGWREAAGPGSIHRVQPYVIYGGSWLRGCKKLGIQSAIIQGAGEGDAGLGKNDGACGW